MKRVVLLTIALISVGNRAAATVTQNVRICEAPPPQTPGQWGTCLHRYAYKLARAPATNEEVANAVVTACGDEVAWTINHSKPEDRAGLLQAIHRDEHAFALLYVIQARAGHCDIPE